MRRSTTAATLTLCLGVATLLTGCANIKPAASAAEHDHNHAQPAGEASKRASMMDDQMMRMQEMHEKMMAAKTPAERAALMKDHMKAMRDGMAMMDNMKGMPGKGDMGMSHEMMGKRMDMMEMMMKMMMDRESGGPMPHGR